MPSFLLLPPLFHSCLPLPPPFPPLPLTSHLAPFLYPPTYPSPTLTPSLPLPYTAPPTPSSPLPSSPLPSPPPQLHMHILFDDELKMNLTTELKEGDLPEQLADDLVTNRLVNEESGLCVSGARGGHGRVGTCVNLPTLYHCL